MLFVKRTLLGLMDASLLRRPVVHLGAHPRGPQVLDGDLGVLAVEAARPVLVVAAPVAQQVQVLPDKVARLGGLDGAVVVVVELEAIV